MVAHAYKPSSQEKREWEVQGQLGLHSKTLSKKKKRKGNQKGKERMLGRKEENTAGDNNHGHFLMMYLRKFNAILCYIAFL